MRNLTDSAVDSGEGLLFLFLGLAGGMLLFLQHPTQNVVSSRCTVWAFCRFYYFAFYVTQNYVDPNFRFNGLFSAARYWLWTKKNADSMPVFAEAPDAFRHINQTLKRSTAC